MLPLEGITVLEFAQFMAGPSAGLKMADLGARVIKIERPGSGESGRKIAIKNLFIGDDSLVFHTANRNKESYAANLKDPEDLKLVKKLIGLADVMTHNFRPGVMEKIGLDYDTVSAINPRIVFGVVSGYGTTGPWAKRPGQDLLIQSLSGVNYLTGNANDTPTPTGIATSDLFTGADLVQGIIAALIQREQTGTGAKIEVSLLESTIGLQFELLTTYLNDGNQLPQRAKNGNAHTHLPAPYGTYKTADNYIAIAMTPVTALSAAMGIELPKEYSDKSTWFCKRNEIMAWFGKVFLNKTTEEWVSQLEDKNIWCSNVFEYKEILNHPAYKVVKMDQEVETIDGEILKTTRCPIRIDGERIFSRQSAPKTGQDTEAITKEFNLI